MVKHEHCSQCGQIVSSSMGQRVHFNMRIKVPGCYDKWTVRTIKGIYCNVGCMRIQLAEQFKFTEREAVAKLQAEITRLDDVVKGKDSEISRLTRRIDSANREIDRLNERCYSIQRGNRSSGFPSMSDDSYRFSRY